jgi:hypothetical protein
VIVGRSCLHKCFETAGLLSKLPGAPEGLEPLGFHWASGRFQEASESKSIPGNCWRQLLPTHTGDVAEGGADRDLG